LTHGAAGQPHPGTRTGEASASNMIAIIEAHTDIEWYVGARGYLVDFVVHVASAASRY
jgi:hypothetical protein